MKPVNSTPENTADIKQMSMINYQTFGKNANFYKSLVLWFLIAINLVVDPRMLTTAEAINTSQAPIESSVRKVKEEFWMSISPAITSVIVN